MTASNTPKAKAKPTFSRAYTLEELQAVMASIQSGKAFAKGVTAEQVNATREVIAFFRTVSGGLASKFDKAIREVRENGNPNYLKGVEYFTEPGRGRKPGTVKTDKPLTAEELLAKGIFTATS